MSIQLRQTSSDLKLTVFTVLSSSNPDVDFLSVRDRRTPSNRPLSELSVETFREVICEIDLHVGFLII